MSDEKKITPKEYNEIVQHFINGTSPPAPKKPKTDDRAFCYHNFQTYKGLNSTDEFCEKCGLKRNLPSEVQDTDWNHDSEGSF